MDHNTASNLMDVDESLDYMDADTPWKGTDSPWADDGTSAPTHNETEWTRLTEEFTNAGYREGITAGKLSTLQEGFDAAFATVGVPLGRELGNARGRAAALLAAGVDVEEVRAIAARLAGVRLSDISPRDLEAEEHAREHLEQEKEKEQDNTLGEDEAITHKRDLEQLEDLFAGAGLGAGGKGKEKEVRRPTIEDVQEMARRLDELAENVGADRS